eukprot:2088817-Amphidinium_carterae.1
MHFFIYSGTHACLTTDPTYFAGGAFTPPSSGGSLISYPIVIDLSLLLSLLTYLIQYSAPGCLGKT